MRSRVCETQFNREMTVVEKGLQSTKTLAFPNAIKEVLDNAFDFAPLRSVVLNGGWRSSGNSKKDTATANLEYLAMQKYSMPCSRRR